MSKITYGTPKTLDNGGKSIYVGINNRPLVIQTPEMEAPFGMSTWNGDKNEASSKCTVELSFKGKDSNKSMEYFYDMLEKLDTKLVEEGMNNSASWFKKKYNTTEVVEALYTHMLKHYKDKETGEISDKYPPRFRLSIPFKDNKIACPIYNKNKEPIELSDIEKGSKVTAIVQCLGIWIAGGKFGCTWKVVQLRVQPPASFKGFAFKDVDDENDKGSDIVEDKQSSGDDEDIPAPDEDIDEAVQANEDATEKPDDDDIIESSEDEIEAPKAKATKKVVAKAAAAKKK